MYCVPYIRFQPKMSEVVTASDLELWVTYAPTITVSDVADYIDGSNSAR